LSKTSLFNIYHMILSEKINIKVNSRNFDYYKNFINEIKNNEIYEISIENIFPTSHLKIEVKCDVCESVSFKPYREYMTSFSKYNLYCCSPKCSQLKNVKTNLEKYGVKNVFEDENVKKNIKNTNLEKYGVEYPSQSSSIREKSKQTSIKNYGVDWASKSVDIKNKIKNTCLEKYGVENFNHSEYSKLIRIQKGLQIPDNLKSDFEIYRNIIRKETNKLKKIILENWNGLDFYDGEDISENFKLPFYDKNYPTIDHKTSIYHGFMNCINPELIYSLENLCITKRSINASKCIKCR